MAAAIASTTIIFNDQQNQSRGPALLAGVTLVLIFARGADAALIPKGKGGRLQCARRGYDPTKNSGSIIGGRTAHHVPAGHYHFRNDHLGR